MGGKKKQRKKQTSGSLFPPTAKAEPLQQRSTPNLFWTALDYEDLNSHTRFIPLKPAPSIVLYPPSSFRYVSQASAQWRAGHSGLITTGNLKDALGFREERVARSMGLQADHGGLLRVFHHLLQPLHPAFEPPTVATDPSAREATNPIDSSGGEQLQQHSPPNSSAMSCRRRRRRRQQQQQQQQHLPENDPADGVSAEVPQGPQPLLPRPRLVSAVSCGQVAGRATVASTTQHGIPPAPLPGKPAATDKEQVRLKVCLRSAATGLSEVCMRWGQVQEPASLYAMLQIFPRALIYEVGMFVVPASLLPMHWGFSQGSLPPLGSSPDGLIAHPVHAPLGQLKWLMQTCARLATFQASPHEDGMGSDCIGVHVSSSRHNSSSHNSGDNNNGGRVDSKELGALKHKVRATLQHLLQQVPVKLGQQERGDQEPDAGGWAGSTGKGAAHRVCDRMTEGPSDDGVRGRRPGTAEDLPLCPEATNEEDAALCEALVALAASAAGAAQLLGACTPIVTAGCMGEDSGVVKAEEQQVHTCQGQGQQHSTGSLPANAAKMQHALVLEVVEVKNTVPFSQTTRRSGARGGTKVEYCVRDRGPRDGVAPHWIPQLMLHMLATGTWSALLISRSVTKGIRAFRIFRDDEYLFRMISIISRLYTQYVLQGQEPPPNAFMSEPSYASLLSNTARIARSAIEVAHFMGPAPRPDFVDERAFI